MTRLKHLNYLKNKKTNNFRQIRKRVIKKNIYEFIILVFYAPYT